MAIKQKRWLRLPRYSVYNCVTGLIEKRLAYTGADAAKACGISFNSQTGQATGTGSSHGLQLFDKRNNLVAVVKQISKGSIGVPQLV